MLLWEKSQQKDKDKRSYDSDLVENFRIRSHLNVATITLAY